MNNQSSRFSGIRSTFRVLLPYFALAGNGLFILWILRNGINEGFRATLVEKVSYIGLIVLLLLNMLLIYPLTRRS